MVHALGDTQEEPVDVVVVGWGQPVELQPTVAVFEEDPVRKPAVEVGRELQDGAVRRVPWVALALGMIDKTAQVVDYSHAVQMLHTIAASCAGWSERQRRSWVDRVETQLYNGDIDAVSC